MDLRELGDFTPWLGRTQEARDVVTPQMVAAFNATFDRDAGETDDTLPAGGHWTLCQPRVPEHALGPDGHPARGQFLPPVPLPRRMWASSAVTLIAPFRVGDTVDLRSAIVAITPKTGASGPLVFVDVDHAWSVDGIVRARERHTIVYREHPPAGAPATNTSTGLPADEKPWTLHRRVTPSTTMLFRYSAITFNGHRIHYDQDYVRAVEGYADLIVHGPLTASLLLHLGLGRPERLPVSFSFWGHRPLFVGRPIDLRGLEQDGRTLLAAHDDQGLLAMSAELKRLER